MENGASVRAQPVSYPIDAEIESLARESDTPVELVQAIYASERAKLEQTARIKIYVPLLIYRHVKGLLRERRAPL
jgi:hypothetical protein